MRALALIVISLLGAMTLLFLAAESLGWMDAQTITKWMHSASGSPAGRATVAAIVFILLAGDLLLPVPSSIVMTLAGALLGWGAGTLANFAGAMASALVGFALCRRYGRNAFHRLVGTRDAARIERLAKHYGAWGILLSRGVPMLTEIVSCLAGLSHISWRAFLLLAGAGTLPLCCVYAWAGSRGLQSGFGWALLIALILPALGLAWLRWRMPPEPTAT